MATLKGVWEGNDVISIVTIAQLVNFVSNGKSFNELLANTTTECMNYVVYDDAGNYVSRQTGYSMTKGWTQAYRTVDFGETKQNVSDDFYTWFTANFTPVDETATEITYNGATTSLEAGRTATLPCSSKKMASDIVIVFGAPGTITYNGTETAVSAGQTATMACNGKKMKSDVVVSL